MPRSDRRRKQQEKKRHEAAKNIRSLYDWIHPGARASTSHQSIESTNENEHVETGETESQESEAPSSLHSSEEEATVDELQMSETEDMDPDSLVHEQFAMLPGLQHSSDPAHIVTYGLKYNESLINFCVHAGPCRPIIVYPKNSEGRSFQKQWYEKNSWLEYSPQADSMFCFSCRLFLNDGKYKNRTIWKSEGINRWRTALEKIKDHAGSESHMMSMIRWKSFEKQTLNAAIQTADRQAQAANAKLRHTNREILSRLISITLFLARQGLAFRGADESRSSENRGNFLELVDVLGRYDSTIKMHLDLIKQKQETLKRPQVSLLSNRTQNDLIKVLAITMRKEIMKEIHESRIFSILIDETTDASHNEQLSFCMRYVHDFEVKERFIQVCEVQSTTGENLETVVLTLLEENGLNIEDMRGQGYDGAANMSGPYKGLQSRLQKRNPKALYVHCHAHCLNLVLVESAKSNIHFVTFFNLVEKLYAFIANSSKRHAAFINIQRNMYPEQHPLELQKLSDTRWACRESALRTLRKVIGALKQFLEELTLKVPPDVSAGDALILLRSIDFEFILCLEITAPIFRETAYSSDALQQQNLDLSVAYKIVEALLQSMKLLRNEEKFKDIMKAAKDKAEVMGIDMPSVVPGSSRKRKTPGRYKYSVTSATEDEMFQSVEHYYRVKVFYVFLDSLTQELERRFKGDGNGDSTSEILKAFFSLTERERWIHTTDENSVKSVQKLCKFYDREEVDKLQSELKVFHSTFPCPSQNAVGNMLKTLKENNIQEIFPNLTELLKIYATVPVTTATVERSFSKLKLVKTKIRSLCGEERLSDLLLLGIEKDVHVNYDEVIDTFKSIANRKLLL